MALTEVLKEGSEMRGVKKRGKRPVKPVQRTFGDCLQYVLSLGSVDVQKQEMMTEVGVKKQDMSNKMVLAVMLFLQAAEGNVQALKEVRQILGGEADADKQGDIVKTLEEKIAGVDEMIAQFAAMSGGV